MDFQLIPLNGISLKTSLQIKQKLNFGIVIKEQFNFLYFIFIAFVMVSGFKMISSVDERLQKFYKDLKKEIPRIQIGEGYRTNKKQEEIYWSQRDRKTGELMPGIRPEDVATWARGGQSAHNHRKAFDVDEINLRTDKEKIDSILKNHPDIQWGYYFERANGRWNDPRHFQIKDWRKNKLIRSGISLVGVIFLLLFAYFLYTQFFLKTQKKSVQIEREEK